MQLGIFAKTFPGTDPQTVLASVRAAGFGAAQYNLACSGLPAMPDDVPPGIADAVRTASAATGVSISAVSGTYNMAHPDPAVREAGHRRLEAIAASCRAMGTEVITLCTGTRDPHDQWRGHADNASPSAWRDLLASMETAIGIAERHGVRLGIEPELANVIDSAAQARRLFDELRSDRLCIVLDPANLFEVATPDAQRRTVAEAIDLLAGHIAMGHAKDRHADGRFATAGTGVLDYRHYLGCLKRVGFEGPLITHGLAADEAAGVGRFLRGLCDELGGL